MRATSIVGAALAAGLAALAPQPLRAEAPSLLARARQLVLVITPGWDDVRGELRRFGAGPSPGWWQPVGASTAIVVGRSGLAWDPALEQTIPGPVKREGDGRSPAGVFALGTAFGFAAGAEAAWLKMPYLPITEGIECVDDPASTVYNQIVDRRKVSAPDWNSSEKMRDIGEPYRWGVVVNYNTAPATPRHGSCIFLHIGGGEGSKGTAGCTAMPAADLRTVLEWIDPRQSPVIVQLPRPAYETLKTVWQLP
jgi:D-alanyl-D-alanine dipeptidase